MRLDQAFDEAIRKFYDNYEFEESAKMDPRLQEYSFGTLDGLHKELVPKRKPVVEEVIEEDVI